MDISLVKNSNGQYDWNVSSGNLSLGDDLSSAILVSLLTYGRADDTHTTIPFNEKRGWWGSYLFSNMTFCQYWTLFQMSIDTTTLQLTLYNYTMQALQWLVSDGVVSSFNITVTIISSSKAFIVINANKPDGNIETYSYVWNK
ncbi:phage GP46 family protein [Gluconacetobacter diazotrophicus]|uniref:phage GP46 family protein n=1 Tax=Gluconacetobacter diazotrophicus TaxID=33996 RepID=UPI0011A36AC9|nr:phage GP46 family protein [Gluconacetobacter diazotrophicus]